MKLTIERSPLLKALAHVQNVVERRSTLPILANVLLDARSGGVSLNATDLELDFIETIAADVSRPGTATAPAHTLFDIVKRLPDGSQVEISQADDESQMTLRSGRSTFSLTCLPVDDFPALSGGDLPHVFTLPSAELALLIDRTRFAISTEETRYYLNGIYFHAGAEGTLRAVATDGHRLARTDVALPEGAAGMPGVIIPRKAVNEVYKLIGETDAMVEIALSSSKLRFSVGSATLTTKLIDGTFPDYERVIPTDNDKMLTVDAKVLIDAVGRVTAISSEKSRAVKLAVGKNTLTLSASSAETGSAVEEIEASYTADALDIGFNSRYLLDVLDQIGTGSVGFALADAASPAVVRDPVNSGAVYVLMPMRV